MGWFKHGWKHFRFGQLVFELYQVYIIGQFVYFIITFFQMGNEICPHRDDQGSDQVGAQGELGSEHIKSQEMGEDCDQKATRKGDTSSAEPIKMANYYFRKKKYAPAEQIYKELLEEDPENAEYHYRYGCLLFKTFKFEDCESELKKSLELYPESSRAHKKYGELLGFMGKIGQAQEQYQLAEKFKGGDEDEDDNWAPEDDPLEEKKPEPQPEQEKSLCIVCQDQQISHTNKACGHLCVCEDCAAKLNNQCPLCKRQGSFIKIYHP